MATPSPRVRELVEELLHRPLVQRGREHKYRFAQSLVFGLPVIALQFIGPRLGGAESQRWIALFQAALSMWVTYIAATGMISEGVVMLLARRRFTKDLLVGLIALGLEAFSFISASHLLVDGTIWYRPLLFHVVVIILIIWSGIQWAVSTLSLRMTEDALRKSSKL
jgi:cation transport ATPase